MRSLLEDEIKHLGAKTAKSNAGAKLTATISAVDGRLTTLKTVKEGAKTKPKTASYFVKAPLAVATSEIGESSSSPSLSSSSSYSCGSLRVCYPIQPIRCCFHVSIFVLTATTLNY